jgi:hypothetical protein
MFNYYYVLATRLRFIVSITDVWRVYWTQPVEDVGLSLRNSTYSRFNLYLL